MVRPQLRLRRAIAVFTLTSILPLASASAAVHPHGEHGRAPRTEARKEATSGIKGLVLLLLEKSGIRIDPNGIGIVTNSALDGPH